MGQLKTVKSGHLWLENFDHENESQMEHGALVLNVRIQNVIFHNSGHYMWLIHVVFHISHFRVISFLYNWHMRPYQIIYRTT